MVEQLEPVAAPALPRSSGRLEAALRAGHFAITAETTPPDSCDPRELLERVGAMAGLADAVNVTDGAGARVHLSPLAAAAILAREGIEPVLQFTMRDRNRLALQADVMGAAALGIPNILALRGDEPMVGDQPEAKPVYDLDSVGLLRMARAMRDQGVYPSGRAIKNPPRLFLGCADMPIDPPPDWEPVSLLAKIDAGADFVQTQYCFDLDVLRRYLARLADLGIPERLYILVGIGPIGSARSARWMIDNLPGVSIPEPIVARLEGAADQAAEGRAVCLEHLAELTGIDGVAGAHLMAPRQEQGIAEVIRASGLVEARNDGS